MSREQFEQLVTVPEWADFDPVHGYSNPEWQDLDPATNFVRLDELSRINAAWCAYQFRQPEIDALNARIAELEAQVRKQGLALEKMAAEFGMKGKDEDAHHPVFAYFAAAEECRKEARRLRGEGER